MQTQSRTPLAVSLLLLVAAASCARKQPVPAPAAAPRATPAAPAAGLFTPPPPTKTTGCKMQGALPDPACTPGAVMNITVAVVCNTSTSGRRKVTSATKDKAYAAYGVSRSQPSGAYEVDHFIPLELGGSNDIANLWPQPASPKPGFHQKDCVEDYLHAQVCTSHTMTLAEAQQSIATDWLTVFTTKASHTTTGQCKKFAK
jgi:hypothetical protein